MIRAPGVVGALAGGIVVITSVDLIVAYLPALGTASGIGPEVVGLLLAAFSVTQIAARLAVGRLSGRYGLVQMLCVSMLIAAVALPFVAAEPPTVFILAALGLAGFGLGIGIPLTLVRLADMTPQESHGVANGVRFTLNRSGQVAVPAAVGGSFGHFGGPVVLLAVALMLALTAAGTWATRVRGSAKREKRNGARDSEGPP